MNSVKRSFSMHFFHSCPRPLVGDQVCPSFCCKDQNPLLIHSLNTIGPCRQWQPQDGQSCTLNATNDRFHHERLRHAALLAYRCGNQCLIRASQYLYRDVVIQKQLLLVLRITRRPITLSKRLDPLLVYFCATTPGPLSPRCLGYRQSSLLS
jgi:hypothetical protein